MNKISVIIPVLNEAENIATLLQHLLKVSSPENIAEIIIVDGGSTDGSQDIISNFISSKPKIKLITSEKGRAKQMNVGAKASKGDILYFLHADSFPPKLFCQHIIDAIKNKQLAGCFKMKFDHNHWWLRLASWLTQFKWRACRGGDQIVVLQHWITTSARRYETSGIWTLQYHFWTIYVKKWFGASAKDLHNYYLKHIA